ncbi:MAG: 2-oxoisovalerate dehydrogenase [Gemmatimonadetes bacterium]|nr:2-oxoisovalerate dehydrogenase [Gemmatimonadota bacterium]
MAAPSEIIFEVIESDEGGYEARALGHSIFTQGEDWNELKEMAREAVLCHFDEIDTPKVIRLHQVREEAIAV